MIQLIVYGEPVAQGRPRFARRGNFVTTYDPKKSRDYKDTVYSIAVEKRPDNLLEGPLSVKIKAFKGIPKSFSKKKMADAEAGILLPVTKPDCDNYAKGVKDALKGVIWRDDSQVVRLVIEKMYSAIPRLEVEISEVTPA